MEICLCWLAASYDDELFFFVVAGSKIYIFGFCRLLITEHLYLLCVFQNYSQTELRNYIKFIFYWRCYRRVQVSFSFENEQYFPLWT